MLVALAKANSGLSLTRQLSNRAPGVVFDSEEQNALLGGEFAQLRKNKGLSNKL